MESDKQAAPVSAGEVKRWGLVVRQGHALMDVVENGQWIPVADHLSAMKAMQERIATLEAELLSVAKEKMAAERDKNRAESELAAYKASLPERAKRAANIFGGSPSAILSQYDGVTKYEAGKIVRCNSWDEDRWNECAGGIHLFLTREEAEAFQNTVV